MRSIVLSSLPDSPGGTLILIPAAIGPSSRVLRVVRKGARKAKIPLTPATGPGVSLAWPAGGAVCPGWR